MYRDANRVHFEHRKTDTGSIPAFHENPRDTFLLMYACAAIVYALPISAGSIYILTAWCIAHPSAFILPGLLYGLS